MIVEANQSVADEANRDGCVVVVGDCARKAVLRRAGSISPGIHRGRGLTDIGLARRASRSSGTVG